MNHQNKKTSRCDNFKHWYWKHYY